MSSVKITAKRQATLPKQLCEEMRLQPGDRVQIEQRTIDAQTFWRLIPPRKTQLSFIGRIGEHAKGKSGDMAEIRAAIVAGRTDKKNQ